MSNLLAGVGIAQLERLDELVLAQRSVNARYGSIFARHDALRMMPNHPEGIPSNWLSVVTVSAELGIDTEWVRQQLDGAGIEARAVWKPLHMQGAYHGAEVVGGEVSEQLFRTGLCLPSGTQLGAADIDFIAAAVMQVVENAPSVAPDAVIADGWAAAGG